VGFVPHWQVAYLLQIHLFARNKGVASMSRATGASLAAGMRCRRLRAAVALAVVATIFAAGGCTSTKYVTLRSVPRSPLAGQLMLTSWKGPRPTPRTMQVLRRHDLVGELNGDPRLPVDKLQAVFASSPSAENLYSLAELSFLGGKKLEAKSEDAALDLYGAAVNHAYMYLFDPRYAQQRNPYDPQFRKACDLYNGALESSMRIVRKRGGLLPGKSHSIESGGQHWDVTVVVNGNRWRPEDFVRFEFASDYEVQGLTNRYETYGLGVPLIAVCKNTRSTGDQSEFIPPELSFAVTAFLRVLPDAGAGAGTTDASHHCVLELYDPLVSTDIVLGDRRIPLESDLSTPLAYFLNDPRLERLATVGLLQPDGVQSVRGLYMLEPYEPGKIPVLMVHGLWSSPLTWMEMFNDLRSVREIRDHFQFWFYIYPTGQPFWNSAAQMREDLAHVRRVIDPQHREPALDQMVLVGHSMGGLVSRLQTIDSGEEFWRLCSDRPFAEVKASPEERQQLARTFFFHPNPSIRRVITIGTPLHGSKFANDTTRWLAEKVITLPERTLRGRDELVRENPGLFRTASLCEVKTSLDSLSPDSPVFSVLASARRPAWVKYHNIVGVVPRKGIFGWIAHNGDGAVSYRSAHADGVESELVVQADHLTVHRHPLAVLEVQKILLLHLDELRHFPNAPPRRDRVAAVTGTGPL
jgi:Alpha/beta hydrolase family